MPNEPNKLSASSRTIAKGKGPANALETAISSSLGPGSGSLRPAYTIKLTPTPEPALTATYIEANL